MGTQKSTVEKCFDDEWSKSNSQKANDNAQEKKIYSTLMKVDFFSHNPIWTQIATSLDQLLSNRHVSILDLGCGNAEHLSRTLKNISIDKYIGVDLSEQALQVAEMNMQTYQCDMQFMKGDMQNIIQDLLHRQYKFDVIISGYAVHHIENKTQLFKEIHELLKDNGYFFIYDAVCREQESRKDYRHRHLSEIIKNKEIASEKERIRQHLDDDHPETFSSLCTLASNTGFDTPESLFWDKLELFNLSLLRAKKVSF